MEKRFDDLTDLVERVQNVEVEQSLTGNEQQVTNAQGEKITLDDGM